LEQRGDFREKGVEKKSRGRRFVLKKRIKYKERTNDRERERTTEGEEQNREKSRKGQVLF
jgi:hypothetical protein